MFFEAHPHIDPRSPRDGSASRTNPPVFVWKPVDRNTSGKFRLTVAKDPSFIKPVMVIKGLTDPLYLPETKFDQGEYWWKWSTNRSESTVFRFVIEESAVVLEVPPADEWLNRLPKERPRLYLPPSRIGVLRRRRDENPLWPALKAEADSLLEEPHDLPEPDFLPDRHIDYPRFFDAFQKAMWESRRFARGAEMLGLAWLVSGNTPYADAACRRISALCRWDPDGATSLTNNDEAHMSILWYGVSAADWVWDSFSEAQRKVVAAHLRRRVQITYEHMHDLGTYGIDRFDSHAGREIVFLAWTLLAFHEHIPGSLEMLRWLRPVLCGIWPVWAEDDGGWAEGMSYSLPYVTIMSRFAYILKRGVGVDLFSRPFWKAHAEWRMWCFPTYAQWMGFGDHSEVWEETCLRNADLVELIASENRSEEFGEYVEAFRSRAPSMPTREHAVPYSFSPMAFLNRSGIDDDQGKDSPESANLRPPHLKVFDGVGWAALRTARDEPENDVALIFRSSRFGSISHSHANNNDFILHVAGTALATPSGYYIGYGSPHHATWVWHTKSHNCATLSDASQKMRSYDSTGAIRNAFENDDLVYFCGNADASFDHMASRYRRHVLYLKEQRTFALIDEFVAKRGQLASYQWNIHSCHTVTKDDTDRSFIISDSDGSDSNPKVHGAVLYEGSSYWSLTDGWDPPPDIGERGKGVRNQHHLRFSTGTLVERLNLAVILRPEWKGSPAVEFEWRTTDAANTAYLPKAEIAVYREDGAFARAMVKGANYVIDDEGISRVV